MRLRILILGLTLSLMLRAQFKPEPGTSSLQSRYDRATWQSPESLVRDLRSDDDGTRSKALLAFGYPKDQIHDEVPKPDEIEVRYAAIGGDATLDSIVAIDVMGDLAYVAVAIPEGGVWRRIGVFHCWCKYESDPIHPFVDVHLAASRSRPGSELVLRPSGGGTGVYARDEVHFRVHNGALRNVMAIESFLRSCPDTCTVINRTFRDGVLIESKERFDATAPPQNAMCLQYEWDEPAFRYKRVGPATKCSKSDKIP
jgi:hypothetical protein